MWSGFAPLLRGDHLDDMLLASGFDPIAQTLHGSGYDTHHNPLWINAIKPYEISTANRVANHYLVTRARERRSLDFKSQRVLPLRRDLKPEFRSFADLGKRVSLWERHASKAGTLTEYPTMVSEQTSTFNFMVDSLLTVTPRPFQDRADLA